MLGEFAGQDDNTLIAAYLVDHAMKDSKVEFDPKADLVIGVDVARFGSDRTVLCYRRANYVEDFKIYRQKDTQEVAGIVRNEARLHGAKEVCIDGNGLGAGVVDALRHMDDMPCPVRDVNVAESSSMNPKANRLRDDLWLQVRDWLATKLVKLPDLDGLREELVTPTYSYNQADRIVVESKDSMRKRMSRSPDLADALCLTMAGQAARAMGRGGNKYWGKPLKRNIKGI
ncbi:hypothetical protein JNW90_13710 [Micromonospora sp. STR1s_5]|nr:hypothetical protein [Micromonospora sp. STR1s_5]